MENQPPKTGKFALNYGLLLGLIGVVLGVMLYSMDMHYQGGWSILAIVLAIDLAIVILGMHQFKKANNGYLTFAQGLKVGVGIVLVGGIIGIIYYLLLVNVMDPDMMAKQLEVSRAQMQERGMTEEEISRAIEGSKFFMGDFMQVLFRLVGSLIFGFLLSLIPALVMKKAPSDY